ncbi:MAG: 3-oxoacyl-[acyl-carrier-protein] reductase [Mesorhizobium sp.]|nr:MAG: 3-oxoacyl-[acyl-carrier-protein] reductase [Mesorhizobium sp.]
MSKVAIVTGGSRGIGAAISIALKKAGYSVAANYAGNDEAAAKFKAETGIPVYKWSVADYDACAAGIRQVEADLGPVSVLVNNAGITKDGLFVRMSDADWDSVLEVNLTAVFRLTRELTHPMMRRRHGRIINITSVVGVTGNPGQTNYCASKAGMIGFSKSLAQEIATRNITVNCVAPGFIESAMTDKLNDKQKETIMAAIPTRRMGTSAEVASAVAYLASNEAAYVTGQTIHVNGGMAMI